MRSAPRLTTIRSAAVSLVLFVAAVGCGSPGAAGASGDGVFEVTTSQFFVRVVNQSGGALRDVRVVIVPVGRATEFSAGSYSRLESGQRHDFSLGEFRGDDGTPFSLRVHQPQTVRVTGTDINGEEVVSEVRW